MHEDPTALDTSDGHSVPQVPQFFISVSRLTHVSSHKLVPLFVHAGPHRAFTQISWLPQVRPQTPQFFLSVKISTQELPQGIWPDEQDNSGVIVTRGLVFTTGAEISCRRHRPFWQFCPDVQEFPHDPQFPVSFRRSMQVPLQEFRPVGHDPCVPTAVGDIRAAPAGVVPDDTAEDPFLLWPDDELNCPFLQISP
jgi:hypothetical protein